MPFSKAHRYPYLRLLIPFILGILFGDTLIFYVSFLPLHTLCLACSFSTLFCLFSFFFNGSYSKYVFGFTLYLCFFLAGAFSTAWRLKQTIYPFPQKNVAYRGTIVESPHIKEHQVSLRMRLSGANDSLAAQLVDKEILLSLSKDSASEQLLRGDELLFYTHLSIPRNKGNPDEFDYARYLLRRGISGTGFASTGYWKLVAHNASRSLKDMAVDYRRNILALYHSLDLGKDNLAILSALTVGYKYDLSDAIKETYSVSGASHVLALSGLHIGLLYLILLFVLKVIPNRLRYANVVRFLILILALWAFALLTGLSPSVVRSVIMFSLFSLSALIPGKVFSINTLAATAFFMLLYNPFWIFDVGFQLSFVAVTTILLFYPFIYKILKPNNWLLNKIWALVAVSLAAQMGTAPLVMFYFHRYSTYFLLTNLLVMPLVSIIMYLSVALLLLSPASFLLGYIKLPLRWCLDLLNFSVAWVEKLPFSSIDHIWIYPLELWGIYLSVFLLLSYALYRKVKYMFALLFSALFLCSYHLMMFYEDRPPESLMFYNVRNCPVAHCINPNGQSWLVSPDTLANIKNLRRAVSPYWDRLHLSSPAFISVNTDISELTFRNDILSFAGRRVCFVADDRWKNLLTNQPLSVDYLFLCKGYKGRLKWLMKLFSVQTVILDASIQKWHKDQLIGECREMGIHFISLSEEGSACFLL